MHVGRSMKINRPAKHIETKIIFLDNQDMMPRDVVFTQDRCFRLVGTSNLDFQIRLV